MYIKITSIDASIHYIKQDQISLVMKDINNRSWIVIGQHSIEINHLQFDDLVKYLDSIYENTQISCHHKIPVTDTIEQLELSPRTSEVLKKMNINYVYQLLEMTDIDFLKMRNFGRKSLNELNDNLLEKYDLKIGDGNVK